MATQQEQVRLEGVVSSIVFQNEENGYTILRLEREEEETTVVGVMPGVTPGEFLVVDGSWVRHPTYGSQFSAQAVERRLPQGLKEIFHYLSSGVVKGVGKATARRLIEEFGEETLDVLEQEPEKLTRIKGITLKRAREMGAAFRQQMGMRRLLEFLTQHELPVVIGASLYRAYGDVALDYVRTNPYILIGEEFGIGFSEADRLALELGISGEDIQRLEAALFFELNHNLNNGHSFLPWSKLVDAASQLLGLNGELLETALQGLVDRGDLIWEEIAGQNAVYLPVLHEAETYVAYRIEEMCRAQLLPPNELEKLLERIQCEQGIQYSAEQKEAVTMAATRQVMLLTGGPGTGKTTSLRGVLALFETLGLETALAAPTGRAAKRMGELCGAESSTIHRLLETGFDPHSGRLVFSKGESDPLHVDAVIVDETSMVDVMLMAALLAALRSDCRLVLVGDPDQLPSVGPGNLFSDLIRSDTVPTVRLTEIFRQAQESAIVRSAHLVNGGNLPEIGHKDGDFFFLVRRDAASTVDTIVDLCRRRLPERMGIPVDQIQVLSPTRRRGTGTEALNLAIQQALNPPAEHKGEVRFGSWIFRTGDRVMQIKNNYDILWRDNTTGQAGMGVFNGDIGTILSAGSDCVSVEFDGRQIDYPPEMLGELEPAFAITVHKAQGSEYRAVIFAAFDGAPMLLTRGILYTAITRARTLFIGVGDPDVLACMTQNYRQTRRYSGLRARLIDQ